MSDKPILSARIEREHPPHTTIGAFNRGGKAGELTVNAEDQAKILVILDSNSHADLIAALRCCETTITDLCKIGSTHVVQDWINVRAARHLARAALAKLEATP